MGDYKPVEGDRVRVVLEGEVASDLGYAFTVLTGDEEEARSTISLHGEGHVVSIEKVKPPVVTFKPGDVVRGKHNHAVYAIAETGWLLLSTESGPYGKGFTKGNPSAEFTSENFELVDTSK